MCVRWFKILPMAMLPILAVVGVLLLVLPAKEVQMPTESTYGIILDAGSSHTSMFIYKWPADKQNGTGIVTQHSECHAGKGISSYAGVPGDAAKSLEPCLEQAMKDIPKSRYHQTPLSLGATAGMRIMKIINATESERVLKEVEKKLRSYPFKFKEATILTGQQEGAYGWVTVNYLRENFVKYGFVGRWLNPGRDTVGALDLGGASTQITFEISEKKVEDSGNLMDLELYGKTYKLYTHSFLCYGQDQFLKKLVAHLIKTQGVQSEVFHPCYPKQLKTSINLGKDVFDSPCTKDYRPVQLKSEMSVTLVGTGHYQNCLDNITEMFSFNNCSYSQCSFNGVFQPGVRGRFMAFSAFYFNYKNIDSLTKIPITSPTQMEKAIQLICNMTISEMIHKTSASKDHLKNVCAVSNFVHILLTRGYHFNELSFPSISFEKKAGGASVGWALGYMLSLSNMVPAESPGLMKTLPSGPWGGILFLFICLLLIALGYLLWIYRSTRAQEDMV